VEARNESSGDVYRNLELAQFSLPQFSLPTLSLPLFSLVQFLHIIFTVFVPASFYLRSKFFKKKATYQYSPSEERLLLEIIISVTNKRKLDGDFLLNTVGKDQEKLL